MRADAALDLATERVAQASDGHGGDQRVHEAFDDQVGGVAAREAAAHQVEKLLFVHLADGGAVSAAKDVVAADLQVGDGVGTRRAAEQEVTVLLVGGGLARVGRDADEAGVDRTGFVCQHAFEEQIAGAVGGAVILQGVAVEMLAAFHCPLTSVRLLRLAARSNIREHKDYNLGFEDGEMRIHVPVLTNLDVAFFLAGERVIMQEGEAWYLDLNLAHRVENQSDTDRIHLVIDCFVNDWVRELFPPEMARTPIRQQI